MTVRLGEITKRGHAEAIFDGFGKFSGLVAGFAKVDAAIPRSDDARSLGGAPSGNSSRDANER
jgi:hypothetical protein